MSTPHLPPESPGGPAGPDEPAAGAPPHAPSPEAGPRPSGTDGFFDAVRRAGVSRSDERWIGGVAAGVAERFGIDPLVVRGILFVTFFLSGAGLVLYGAAWALLPERRDGRIHLQEAFRGNFDVAMLGAIAMVVVGLSWGGGWWSWWDYMNLGWLNGLFWVAAIVTVAIVTVSVLNQRGPRPGAPASGAQAPGGPDAPWGSPAPTTTAPPSAAYPATHESVGPVPAATTPPAVGTASVGTPPAMPYDAQHGSQQYGPQQYGSQQHRPQYGAPAGTTPPAPPRPPKAPRPPKPPRPRGPGSATVGVVVGLSLLLGALLLVVDRAGDLAWPVFLTWAGASVVLAGLAIVVSGLRGRTSGGLGWLAVLALVVAVPAASWDGDRPALVLDDTTRTVSDGTYRVTDPDVASEGFGVRWGDPTIDLSGLDLSGVTDGDPVEVPVQLGAGDVTIVVPDGVPVRADVQVWAGSARWQVDGERREVSGVSSRPVTFTNEEADAGEDPQLVLLVDVGAGQATIEEDR